jgi:hypothetical protein
VCGMYWLYTQGGGCQFSGVGICCKIRITLLEREWISVHVKKLVLNQLVSLKQCSGSVRFCYRSRSSDPLSDFTDPDSDSDLDTDPDLPRLLAMVNVFKHHITYRNKGK